MASWAGTQLITLLAVTTGSFSAGHVKTANLENEHLIQRMLPLQF